MKIDQLQPAQVSAFYQDELRRLSPGRVRRLHALLRRSLTVAVRWQLSSWNPVLAVDPPSIQTKEVQPFSAGEVRRFLRAIQGDRLEARWTLAVMVGLRQGEVLDLSWSDVDLDPATMRVTRALRYRSGEGLQLVQPKTTRSRRTVPLPDSIVDSLKLRRKQELDRQAAGEFWEDRGLAFTTKVGTPFSTRNDYRKFLTVLTSAGLRQVRLHDLRHTAASLMLAQGVPARVVMQTLGHSQISLTLNTYSHVSPEFSREAAIRMDTLMADSEDASRTALAASLATSERVDGLSDGAGDGGQASDQG